jgi:N-acetyl-gamma-glutamyl-phosphate reductase
VPYGVGAHRHMPEIDQELALLGAAVTTTFTPHLVPLDQGELADCYVTTTRPVADAELDELYAAAYDGEPFVEVVAEPPGTRDVQETNFCRVFAKADPHSGKLIVLSALDNLWKGTSSQAVQNLNLMFGLPETDGLT